MNVERWLNVRAKKLTRQKLLQILFVSGSAWILVVNSATAKEVKAASASAIPHLSEIQLPVTNSSELAQSPTSPPATSEVVQITGVKINSTDKGIEVTLQTSQGQDLQVTNRSTGNDFIVDVPNAQLRLPSGDSFKQDNPIAGVTAIAVINQDANTVRLTVTGATEAPKVELFDSDEGLIFGIGASSSTTPSTPQQPPETS
jgi:iron complex outermembrane recepter protein